MAHTTAQSFLDHNHSFLRTFESHRPPELFGLAARETGNLHGHSQQLLLKEGNAESAFENRFQTGVGVGDGLATLAAFQIGVGHVAGDRAGTDDRHLHHEVVEVHGPVAWQ